MFLGSDFLERCVAGSNKARVGTGKEEVSADKLRYEA